MAVLEISGGRPLSGSVRIGGRKNSAVAILPAALLAEGVSLIENLPEIGDVGTYATILRRLGAHVEAVGPGQLEIDATHVRPDRMPEDVIKKMRASYYLYGVLLGRYGYAEIPLPGGCDIGQRPIDQHLKGFRALGATTAVEHGLVRLAAPNGLTGARIYLDVASVGATINIMLAAVLADGTTVIENAAKEPHVVDLANYLNAMGATIVGAGTQTIKIVGTVSLQGHQHAIIPDEIEAATYMMAVAITGGTAVLEEVVPKHLESISAKLREAGAQVDEQGDRVQIACRRRPEAVNVKTLVYPGFPTDAQQPMTSLLATAVGTSTITETIWENRFAHVAELERMGARIRVEGRMAVIEGVEQLQGARVRATDLRAGAALVVAALAAEGETVVENVEFVDRGYERLADKLRGLGAAVKRRSHAPDINGEPAIEWAVHGGPAAEALGPGA